MYLIVSARRLLMCARLCAWQHKRLFGYVQQVIAVRAKQ